MAKYVNSKGKQKADVNLAKEDLQRIEKIIHDYRDLLVAIGNL